jgi:hypothetical protein
MTKSSSAPDLPSGAGRSVRPARRDDPFALLGWLTDRDRLLLDVLADHHLLTTGQVAQLAFPSLNMAQKRLHRLYRLEVLDRFRWHTRVGSVSWHYTLGPVGATLAAAARGTDPPRPAELRRRITRLATSPRLGHLLGVNGFFTALAGHARVNPGCSLDAWWSERRCAEHYGQIVRPDAYGAWTEASRGVQFFLEYDTGSEPLGRLVAKLPGYADLATAGGPSLPVLFWLPSAAREAHLRRLLAERPACGVAVATAPADLAGATGASPAGPVWLSAGAGHRGRLIDLAAIGSPSER